MAKDLDFAVGQGEAHGGLVAHVGLDASSKSTPAVSKLLKVWENRQAQQAARVGGLGLMAVSLAACGGSDTTSFSQADIDAAVTTALTPTGSTTAFSSVDAAITSNDTAVSTAATTAALTGSDGTVYTSVDAA
ncbi:MAG: hypothetical protein ACO3O6_12855, partial [Gemmobacter sp.]